MVRLHPNRLEEMSDREDFPHGLAGWSITGTAGESVEDVEGERVLRMQPDGGRPLGATRNFPFGRRGLIRFEVRREGAASGLDLVLNETFLMASSRQAAGAINLALDSEAIPADRW